MRQRVPRGRLRLQDRGELDADATQARLGAVGLDGLVELHDVGHGVEEGHVEVLLEVAHDDLHCRALQAHVGPEGGVWRELEVRSRATPQVQEDMSIAVAKQAFYSD